MYMCEGTHCQLVKYDHKYPSIHGRGCSLNDLSAYGGMSRWGEGGREEGREEEKVREEEIRRRKRQGEREEQREGEKVI